MCRRGVGSLVCREVHRETEKVETRTHCVEPTLCRCCKVLQLCWVRVGIRRARTTSGRASRAAATTFARGPKRGRDENLELKFPRRLCLQLPRAFWERFQLLPDVSALRRGRDGRLATRKVAVKQGKVVCSSLYEA